MSNTLKLANLVEYLSSLCDNIKTNISNIEQQELTTAKPHYYRGKYLYMIHPRLSGSKRKKEYIGIDPDKQRIALEPYQRSNQLQEERTKLRQLTDLIIVAETESHRVIGLISHRAREMKLDFPDPHP